MQLRSTFGPVARGLAVLSIAVAVLADLPSCGGNSTSNPAPAPSGSSSIAGVVTDDESQALAGATVAIAGKSVVTGADGRYSIAGLADGSGSLTAQHQGHRNYTRAVTIAGATTQSILMRFAGESLIAGPWTGGWSANPGGTGSIVMTLAVDTIAQSIAVTLHLTGSVFGLVVPSDVTLSGTYNTSGTFTTITTVFGNVTFNVPLTATSQAINGTVTNVPGGMISRIDFAGVGSNPASNPLNVVITLNGTVTFTNGSTGTNTITMTCARLSETSRCT